VNKSYKSLIGVVLLIVGVGLAIWGYQLSDSVESQLNELVSGSPTDKVMLMYIGGAVCAAIGLFLLLKK